MKQNIHMYRKLRKYVKANNLLVLLVLLIVQTYVQRLTLVQNKHIHLLKFKFMLAPSIFA